MAAAIALKLADQGRLELNEDVNRKLISWKIPANRFTGRSPVTLLQLLSHTSCLNRPAGGFGYEERYPTTIEVMEGRPPAINHPAEVECIPGSEVRYSNFGYIVIQKLIEDVTREPFAKVARELLLQPLGLQSGIF